MPARNDDASRSGARTPRRDTFRAQPQALLAQFKALRLMSHVGTEHSGTPGRPVSSLRELISAWRDEAALLRRCGALEAAATTETRASELASALAAEEDDVLSAEAAAQVSGYSTRRLRQLVAEGRLENAGRPGAPLYRRADLPRKPAHDIAPASFDASAEAVGLSLWRRGVEDDAA